MAIELKEMAEGKILVVHVSGKLVKEDYKNLVPEAERLIKQHGKIRILLEMKDFHGWDAGALWEDIKYDLKHFSDIERVAMVGEKKWQKGMSWFCRPFTTAKVRYFDQTALDEARQWVEAA
ncbi:MAG: STAS/SEC14 domain-containing protein [Limisphaerales bacterium]